MNIGRIEKEIICSVKDNSLDSAKIFLVKLLDPFKKETGKYIVSVENKLSLGIGDIVLTVAGGSARRIKGNEKMPVTGGISAKIESINIQGS